jgi:hypothetical protein
MNVDQIKRRTTMYFDSKNFNQSLRELWSVIKAPLEVNTLVDPDTQLGNFGPIRSWYNWHAESLTGLIFMLPLGGLAACISIVEILLRFVWLCILVFILPIWAFFALTNNMKLDLPDYEQTWLDPYE